MRISRGALPVPDKDAKLKPADFREVLLAVPEDCVLIGGQAVAWWAERYGIRTDLEGKAREITSRDIDFWGTAEDLRSIASRLNRAPIVPNRYEMTLLVGAIELEIGGTKTALEILHTVPGLDSNNPESVAVPEEVATRPEGKLMVLSPVSLTMSKLHALRHFPQEDRQDWIHLQVCLKSSASFIREVLERDTRVALWNCNRLIDAHRQERHRKLEEKHGFRILDAVPIDSIRASVDRQTGENKEKLSKFLQFQWPRVEGR